MATAQQKQHVGIERKLRMRRALLEEAVPGAVYVPFCGDGDIAVELYTDRQILAVDNDAERVATCRRRLLGASVYKIDADKQMPSWGAELDPFAVADFDAFSYPYDAFRQFWNSAPKARRLVLFFTDGERLAFRVSKGRWPDGKKVSLKTTTERRQMSNRYRSRTLPAWLAEAVAPWTVQRITHYARNKMIYWGAVIDAPEDSAAERPPPAAAAKRATPTTLGPPTAEQIIQVEEALHEAAVSGNVPAMQLWLTNRAPDRWSSSGRMGPPSDEPDGATTGAATPDDAAATLAELARHAPDDDA